MNKKLKLILILLLAVVIAVGVFIYNSKEYTPKNVEGQLNVHFIDVGQADCEFIELNGKTMLIDGGNVDDGELVVSYLKKQGVETLDYVIATHAHEDHVGGLAKVVNSFNVLNAYAPVSEYSSTCFSKFVNACEKQCGLKICTAGEKWDFSDAEVYAFWPFDGSKEETNNSSIVLKIVFGNVSYLFTGDVEKDAETKIVNSGVNLSANVLKVGHHGSSTSTSYYFLRSVLPQYAIISCEKGNSYGHPHKETLNILKQAKAKILRTDELGTIISSTDGENITFTYGKDTETAKAEQGFAGFENPEKIIGNKKSKKYHLETCPNAPKEDNRIYFNSLEEAETQGYTPCSSCIH